MGLSVWEFPKRNLTYTNISYQNKVDLMLFIIAKSI
jgi:hypothetical protein